MTIYTERNSFLFLFFRFRFQVIYIYIHHTLTVLFNMRICFLLVVFIEKGNSIELDIFQLFKRIQRYDLWFLYFDNVQKPGVSSKHLQSKSRFFFFYLNKIKQRIILFTTF